MTRTVWAEEQVQAVKPEYVAPLVGLLCTEQAPTNGQLFEGGGGWFAATRWQRARGVDFPHQKGVPPVEEVANAFGEICNFDNGQADNPEKPEDGSKYTMGNVMKNPQLVRHPYPYSITYLHVLGWENEAGRQSRASAAVEAEQAIVCHSQHTLGSNLVA